jgi:hypothetical protein
MHFSVLVTGTDVEKALAPFHDFGATGEDDEYVVDVPHTSLMEYVRTRMAEGDSLMDALEDYGVEENIVHDLSEVDRKGHNQYGYVLVRDGEIVEAVKRTNPNAQWDWWEVGGRFDECLRTKGGESVNTCTMAELDLEARRAELVEESLREWETIWRVFTESGTPLQWRTFDELFDELGGEGDYSKVSEIFEAQPAVQLFRAHPDLQDLKIRFLLTPPPKSKDDVIVQAEGSAFVTNSIVHNGVWHKNDGTENWFRFMREFYNSLPPDTVITLVDCHC